MSGLQGNFVFIKDLYFFHVYMCGHVHMHAGALGSQKKVLDSPGGGITGGCELPDKGAGT